MIGMTPPRDNALSFTPPIVQRYSKAAHERRRKAERQRQRIVVIDWSLVARNALDRFVLEQTRCVYATAGRRFRVWNGRGYRALTGREFATLWNAIRSEIENQNAKVTIRRIEFGLRVIAMTAPPATPTGKRGVSR